MKFETTSIQEFDQIIIDAIDQFEGKMIEHFEYHRYIHERHKYRSAFYTFSVPYSEYLPLLVDAYFRVEEKLGTRIMGQVRKQLKIYLKVAVNLKLERAVCIFHERNKYPIIYSRKLTGRPFKKPTMTFEQLSGRKWGGRQIIPKPTYNELLRKIKSLSSKINELENSKK